MKKWIKTATRRDIVKRSLGVAVVVGTILVAINCGDHILSGNVTRVDMIKIPMTYMVPYLVSTYASVKAILDN